MKDSIYYNKYIKYKNKYIVLKNKSRFIQIGGYDVNQLQHIGWFEHNSSIDDYLNPIYGVCLRNTHYINNIFHFEFKPILITTQLLINDNGIILPTKNLKLIDPYILGQIIAYNYIIYVLKLINVDNGIHIDSLYQQYRKKIQKSAEIMTKQELKKNVKTNEEILDLNQQIKQLKINILKPYTDTIEHINNELKKILLFKVNDELPNKIQNFFKLHNNIEDFHIMLWCLIICIEQSQYTFKQGIEKYYNGIISVFDIFRPYFVHESELIINKPLNYEFNFTHDQLNAHTNINFELCISKIIKNLGYNFIIHDYGNVELNNICIEQKKYSNCGENAMLNLLNLLFIKSTINGIVFNVENIESENINKYLIEYYKIFNNFNVQKRSIKKQIYGYDMNFEEAFTYLILKYANTNLVFNDECINKENEKSQYNLKSSMNILNTQSNFFQLFENLTGLSLDNINIDNIEISIPENMINDVYGIITIEHDMYGKYQIMIKPGHFTFESVNRKKTKGEFPNCDSSNLNKNQKHYIQIFKSIDNTLDENHIYKQITTLEIIKYFNTMNFNEIDYNNSNIDNRLYTLLFKLSLSDIYNNDTRSRLTIDVDKLNYDLLKFIKINNIFDKLNNYTYYCSNLEFLDIDIFTKLNKLTIESKRNLTKLNLTKLKLLPNIMVLNFIDRDIKFLNKKMQSDIDLSESIHLQKIGDDFMKNNPNLKNIILPPNIEEIGILFLYNCTSIEEIDFSKCMHLKKIGDYFMNNNSSLKKIILPSNIEETNYSFLYNCKLIEEIDLSKCMHLKKIGYNFMNDNSNLKKIILPPNNEKIGNQFLYKCTSIEEIDLSESIHLQKIGDGFMVNNSNLKKIILPPNIEEIGSDFAINCTLIKEIDLSKCMHLKKIGNNFMTNNSNLKKIILPPNIEEIGRTFLRKCTSIEEFDLSNCIHLNKINSMFMNDNSNLKKIILPPNIKEIGSLFLNNCKSIEEIDFSKCIHLIEIDNIVMHNKLKKIRLPPNNSGPAYEKIKLSFGIDWPGFYV
jgi:hypothetical protein